MKIASYLLFVVGAAFFACAGTPPPDTTPAQKSVAADAAFSAEMMACVDPGKYPTRIESDFCVTQTKKRWGRP